MSEAQSLYGTAPANLAVGPLAFAMGDNGDAPARVPGIDVSVYQGGINWPVVFANDGKRFTAVRCTVGNYYADANYEGNMASAKDAGLYVTPYLVVAPAGYNGGPLITAQAHWNYFLDHIGDTVPTLPIVLDCELTRGRTKNEITNLIYNLVGMCYDYQGRYPIIYTRQTWWDPNVNANPLWANCPLWASRFNSYISGPWSDGKYIFRDWDEWRFWQWSDEGVLEGIPSYQCDLDWWNGTLQNLADFAIEEEPAPDPLEERVAALEAWQEQVVDWMNDKNIKDAEQDARLDALEASEPEPIPADAMLVKANQLTHYWGVAGLDNACSGQTPKGKPILEVNEGRIENGEEVLVFKKAAFSCKDDPNDPLIKASGAVYHYRYYYNPDWYIRVAEVDVVEGA